jgi:hypothetical protein
MKTAQKGSGLSALVFLCAGLYLHLPCDQEGYPLIHIIYTWQHDATSGKCCTLSSLHR